MTAASPASSPASVSPVLRRIATPLPKPARSAPRHALRALRRLLDHPDETARAMEVVCALDGEYVDRDLETLLGHPEGRRLLLARPDLLARLADATALDALPEGSVGRAYREHMTRHGLSPGKLVEIRRSQDPRHAGRDELRAWLLEREDLMHDLAHVVSGYGADGLGEAALLAFSCGQRARPSRLLLALGASARVTQVVGRQWLPYVLRAFWRGRRAENLLVMPWEELLPLPLADVRRSLRIEPPEVAHREGVMVLPDGALPV
jgi:ubiquinone biosynthesis protein COQ4